MGIRGVENCLSAHCSKGSVKVNIRDLVSSGTTSTSKVIVVDGNQFYERYLYDRWEWIYGGIQQFIDEIREFVEKFKNIGVNLVFFFMKTFTDPSLRGLWIENRNKNIKYCKKVIDALSQGENLTTRDFIDRPLNLKYLAIYFLRKVMKCEVHCAIGTEKDSAIYAAKHKCLAILSQNSYYVFYAGMPPYLSFKALDLQSMTTIQYNIDAFREHVQLQQEFLPLLATLVGDNRLKHTNHPLQVAREKVKKIITQKMNDKKTCFLACAAKFIRNYYVGNDLENVPRFLIEQFGMNGQELIASYDDFKERFTQDEVQPSNASSTWEKILEQTQKLFVLGEMCEEIYGVLNYTFYEHHTILENFEEFPPSGQVYALLRQQLYGILLFESPENSDYKIKEYYQENSGIVTCGVSPATIKDSLHPGLLSLWDTNNLSHELQSKRWKLFVEAISPSHDLDYHIFCNLPRNLVVVVAVLFFLLHEVPIKLLHTKILEPWEVEVFIAVAMMVPKKEKGNTKIQISSGSTNIRAVKLSAFFMCGCRTIHLLAQACGLEAEIDCSIMHYFDGILFHHLYEKAQCRTESLLSEEMIDSFQKIKQILLLNKF